MVAGLGLAVFVCLAAGRLGVPAEEYGDLSEAAARWYVGWLLAAGAVYGLGVVAVRRWAVPRWAVLAGLGFGAAARLVMVATPPVMSTDLYRYVWDGRVQAVGINPYRYKPADPALGFLRDGQTGPEAVFININRPETAKTIYPPAAQMLFAAIGRVWSSVWAIKVVMLGLDLVAGWAGLADAAGGGAAGGVAAGLGAQSACDRGVRGRGACRRAGDGGVGVGDPSGGAGAAEAAGVALGVAVLGKLLPAAIGPAIWRPRTWRAPVVALAVIAAGYGLYWSGEASPLGFLFGYAEEEGMEQGGGFLLLRLLARVGRLPSWAGVGYMLAGLALLDLLAAWVAFRPGGGPRRRDRAGRVAAEHGPACHAIAALSLVSEYVGGAGGGLAAGVGACGRRCAGPLLYLDVGLQQPWWPAIVYGAGGGWAGGGGLEEDGRCLTR